MTIGGSFGDTTVSIAFGDEPKPMREPFAGWEMPGQAVAPSAGFNELAYVDLAKTLTGPAGTAFNPFENTEGDDNMAGEGHWCALDPLKDGSEIAQGTTQ